MPDTNVLVAAAITPRGLCGRLLDAAIQDRWKPVASPLLLGELEEVLARDKFRRWMSIQEAARFVANVRVLADVVDDPTAAGSPPVVDPGDEFLVALVQAADVVALVSGDPHLTSLDLDPPVLAPAAFLDRVGG